MARAILATTLVLIFAIFGVGLSLWLRRPPAQAQETRGGRPLLANRADGSIYDVKLELDEMERRQIDSDRHLKDLKDRLDELTTERQQLRKEVADLRAELQKVRDQRTPKPPPVQPPVTNTPPDTPVTPPVDPVGAGGPQ